MHRSNPTAYVCVGLLMLATAISLTACRTQSAIPDDGLSNTQTHRKVVLYGYEFRPARLTVVPGTEITFHNKDPDRHNVSIPALDIDKSVGPGQTFTHTFETTGEFAVSNERAEKPMKMSLIVRSPKKEGNSQNAKQ